MDLEETGFSGRAEVAAAIGFTARSLHERCRALANNLWWSWHHDVIAIFRDLDPENWRRLDHNPIALLEQFTPERLEARAAEMVLHARINHAYRRLQQYLNEKTLWRRTHTGVLGSRPVAYFSLEFGVHESLPIYSGGLGVLSGDHIKSASGLGVPLVAVGLFYSQGYFKQYLDETGWQQEDYLDTRVRDLPMEPARGPDGRPVTVAIETREGRLLAKVWLVHVGRIRLYLLDCNVAGNSAEDRDLTDRLYGGDQRTRIRQELVAGVGGVRALEVLGIGPGVYHINEGHCTFAVLEAARLRMEKYGEDFEAAFRRITRKTVFTTHTPVEAGHDRFDPGLIEEHLGPLRDELGIGADHLLSLGRVDPGDGGEPFCMTVFGLKSSYRTNAVSALHGMVSRRMWSKLWPARSAGAVPIGHITNGVHVDSWLAGQMQQLYDRHFPTNWGASLGEPEVWHSIHDVDPGELWETHNALKSTLVAFVRRRVERQCRRRGDDARKLRIGCRVLDPNILTIGFARRFATYKRANLILSDLDRLAKLVNDPRRPIQLVFAGKAHPADEPGKELIREVHRLCSDPRFAGRIAFVENYDIRVCRHLVQGVDVWLNTPRRPFEASGTSGQKAVLNGVLNLSILDGWWAEAYDGSNGFAIGDGEHHVDDSVTDRLDGESLYTVLETEVIPRYYDRDPDGLPRAWTETMMNSISSLAWRFSAHRMVADYVRSAYLPAAGGVSCEIVDAP